MEIIVAIAIIVVLNAISIPSYKSYMQKASLTNMLQFIVPYKMHTELCGFEKDISLVTILALLQFQQAGQANMLIILK